MDRRANRGPRPMPSFHFRARPILPIAIGAVAVATAAGFLSMSRTASADAGATAHDFSFVSIDGRPMPLDAYAGKTVLVVNTASRCGFTSQYDGLQTLWETYRDRGLVVIGVPSNDFGNQEPGTEQQIKEFCEVNFSIDFPMTEKTKVSGGDAHPFYRWLVDRFGVVAAPRWNFYKYLIGPDGRAVTWYSAATGPGAASLRRAIEAALPAS